MPKFYYVARSRSGAKETGTEEALNQEDAVTKIQSKGLIVVNVIPEGSELFSSSSTGNSIKVRFKPKHGRVTGEDLTLFCRQLATLIGAGVTILKSLEIISKQVGSRKLYNVCMDLKKSMEAGLSFHEALAAHPNVFSGLWINLIESGEASGNLAVVLSRLAAYLEKEAAFKSKVISALIYPMILTLAGVGALLFLSLKIVPAFAEIFKSFNISLPWLTQMLVNVSDFLKKKIMLLFLFSGAGIFILRKYIQTKSGRLSFEKFQFNLPVFGDFFLAYNIEKFSSEMATLLESGVPILYSLEISGRSVNNLTMADIIRKIKDDVREGKPMRDALERSGFFEPMVVQMVSIGEEIGELPQMFKRINSFYQEYCDTFLARFISMFEPLVLVFIGGVIGVMVVGMFLPIFELAKIGG
ncbi:MAG: type II secretion system F family protein [Candidatus Omnitrophica bacterium]|nr:type II secretion system F family protein [Candidatus Omnitrophota bacterium]MBU4303581.1 type II secretion system F family protein [Candidatus Omnitrophota bacterium]MBU4418271.1 type II secretion system F family protein [Candidatus Omnitrophota bacterium]MBU4468394.1 type II secretion system F family protein [Candidatus Omnitrophota bacterium]MCG2708387.1 type II secretion system F family protein [Candidatus Omnitrophota bacterium]